MNLELACWMLNYEISVSTIWVATYLFRPLIGMSSACACTFHSLCTCLQCPPALVCRADRLASGHSDFLWYMRLLKALDDVDGGVDVLGLVWVRPDAPFCPPRSKLHSHSLTSALVLLRDGR